LIKLQKQKLNVTDTIRKSNEQTRREKYRNKQIRNRPGRTSGRKESAVEN
jgi:hypothetical protein